MVSAFFSSTALSFFVGSLNYQQRVLKQHPCHKRPSNPLWPPPSAANAEMLHQVSRLLKDLGALGYSRDLILQVLHSRTPDEFWELEYSQKNIVSKGI
jgi:hypothetical protein